MLSIAEFDYQLPHEAIAQTPIHPRDSAKLLIDRGPTTAPDHKHVSDLPQLLMPGDLVVANNTKVIPARLDLRKQSGGAAEVLLLEPLRSPVSRSAVSRSAAPLPDTVPDEAASGWWSALVKPSRRLRDGAQLLSQRDDLLRVTIGQRLADTAASNAAGQRAVHLSYDKKPVATPHDVVRLLGTAGEAPLPPYIASPAADPTSPADYHPTAADYQTIYADQPGSVAAPTAGLHLTNEVIEALASRDIGWATVDLVVGLDTFKPVSGELSEHVMHTEQYEVSQSTWQKCQEAKRVVAIGTTTVRALESAARGKHTGRTDLFLKRGDQFQIVDVLLTNFHLPRSTLLVLIDAFIGAHWRNLYETALASGYRFLSFGDAMLLQHPPQPPQLAHPPQPDARATEH